MAFWFEEHLDQRRADLETSRSLSAALSHDV
jgi:hypothetical protein